MKVVASTIAGLAVVLSLSACGSKAGPEAYTEWAQTATLGGTKFTELMEPSGIQGTGNDTCKIVGESATYEAALKDMTERVERLAPSREEMAALVDQAVRNLCPEHVGKLPEK